MLDANNPHDISSIEKCRNIVSEIYRFGVNDKEIIKIIELISLELENTEIMREIHNVVKPKKKIEETKKEFII
tara:strand:+ start:95 stop:313 length:219 start_codon:yes stop_codon:yes gene_type:complete